MYVKEIGKGKCKYKNHQAVYYFHTIIRMENYLVSIWAVIFSDEDGVIALMKAEEEFFNKQHRQLGLWIDFYETKLTDRVIREFIEMINQTRHQITKLGIVGGSSIARWKINRLLKKRDNLLSLPVRYFEDPEDAKTWLVSELE